MSVAPREELDLHRARRVGATASAIAAFVVVKWL